MDPILEISYEIAELCHIPTISPEQKVWFLRTIGGVFYTDYSINIM